MKGKNNNRFFKQKKSVSRSDKIPSNDSALWCNPQEKTTHIHTVPSSKHSSYTHMCLIMHKSEPDFDVENIFLWTWISICLQKGSGRMKDIISGSHLKLQHIFKNISVPTYHIFKWEIDGRKVFSKLFCVLLQRFWDSGK